MGEQQQQPLYYVTALYDYVGASDAELSFYAGDTIEVLEDRDDTWSFARLNGYTGCIPRNYVQVVDESGYTETETTETNYEGMDIASKKIALEKEIKELEIKKQAAEESVAALTRLGNDNEAIYYEIIKLGLLLDADADNEADFLTSVQNLVNDLTNLRTVVQSLKSTAYDLQKKKTEESIAKILNELNSVPSISATRSELSAILQQLVADVKV